MTPGLDSVTRFEFDGKEGKLLLSSFRINQHPRIVLAILKRVYSFIHYLHWISIIWQIVDRSPVPAKRIFRIADTCAVDHPYGWRDASSNCRWCGISCRKWSTRMAAPRCGSSCECPVAIFCWKPWSTRSSWNNPDWNCAGSARAIWGGYSMQKRGRSVRINKASLLRDWPAQFKRNCNLVVIL